MARVSMVQDAEADAVVAEIFAGCEQLMGRVSNSFRVYAKLPGIAVWFLPFLTSLHREGAGGALDSRTLELVSLATSLENSCDYCVAHNSELGNEVGITDGELDELKSGDLGSALSDRDMAVVRWSRSVTRNEAPRDQEAFDALSDWFSEEEVIHITWVCGLFNMLNRVHDSLWIDIETPDVLPKIRSTAHVPAADVLAYVRRAVDQLDNEGGPSYAIPT